MEQARSVSSFRPVHGERPHQRSVREVGDVAFLPVKVAAPAPPVIDPPVIEPKVSEAKIEISLSNGHHIRVSGAYDPDALSRLVRGLRS